MRKLSKIDESIWSDIQKRSSGDIIRREDGKTVHTCLGIDMIIKNQDCKYDEVIKNIINGNTDTDYTVSIANTKELSFSTEELTNARKFLAPYVYMIYDGGRGTDLLANFWSYSEILDFDLDSEFEDIISEDDYISVCKCIATKLKDVGEYFTYVPRRYEILNVQKYNIDYSFMYVLKLISEEDVYYWVSQTDCDYNLLDYVNDMKSRFPELSDIDFIAWTFRDGANIAIPLKLQTLINFKKYKEFTKNWFSVNEETK